jgi:hypothetical protein
MWLDCKNEPQNVLELKILTLCLSGPVLRLSGELITVFSLRLVAFSSGAVKAMTAALNAKTAAAAPEVDGEGKVNVIKAIKAIKSESRLFEAIKSEEAMSLVDSFWELLSIRSPVDEARA